METGVDTRAGKQGKARTEPSRGAKLRYWHDGTTGSWRLAPMVRIVLGELRDTLAE